MQQGKAKGLMVVAVLALAALAAGCDSTDAAHVVGPAVTPRTVAPIPGPVGSSAPPTTAGLSQAALAQIDAQLQQLSRALDQAGGALGPSSGGS
jgi:hypothetical protein